MKSVDVEVMKPKESNVFNGIVNEYKDMVVEVNIVEAPMFKFSKKSTKDFAKDLLNSDTVTIDAKSIMKGMYKENNDVKVEYRDWNDSKGVKRELIIASLKALPDSFCMDVFFGLMGLLIKVNSPMVPNNNGFLEFKTSEVSFSLNQLCKEMRITPGSLTYERIEDALGKLFSVEYYSIGGGSLYNKSENNYISTTAAIKIIRKYQTSKRIKNLETGRVQFHKGNVTFDDLIISNLSLGYARLLRNHKYFALKSGVARGLYLYIESNKIKTTSHLKRSFDVLRNKIPIDFKYPSDLKNKLRKPLDSMVTQNIIKDYFYGDETIVNGVKEQCIYFIFSGTKKQLIDSLTKKPKDVKSIKKVDLESDFKLEFPQDIKQELLDFNINPKKVSELIKKYSKYKLAEYILWIKDGVLSGKVKDSAAMFVFAITDEVVVVKKSHPHITEFIEKIRLEADGKKQISKAIIDSGYREYINAELSVFKEEEELIYNTIRDRILDDIEAVQTKRIKSQRALYNMTDKQEEKDKLLLVIEKWEKFSTDREKSDIFVEQLAKKIKILRGLKDYEEFKAEYLKQNS